MDYSAEKDQKQTSSSSPPPPNQYLSEILHDVSTSIVFNNVAEGYGQEKSGNQAKIIALILSAPNKTNHPKICIKK